MCDKKNNVLFTDTECLVLSSDFKLPDASQVLLRVPRENNMYNVNLKNIIPSGDLTCLFAKATLDESNLWHRSLGHVNFKTINKLVKGYLVRGLPSKVFTNDLSCVACKKGKQHRASCKSKTFYGLKGIKREFSVPKTPQQNGIAKRKNRTLIEAARTLLIDSLLPIPFWAEAVNSACYVQNRVLSVSPDIHSSSCGDQAREQGDKAMNKDKVFAAGLDFINSTNDFTAAGLLVFAAELNFTNSTNDFSAAGPSNAAM
nr:ribonuclease H-like domain-containing protein [Tanacetum cinerariifolium]